MIGNYESTNLSLEGWKQPIGLGLMLRYANDTESFGHDYPQWETMASSCTSQERGPKFDDTVDEDHRCCNHL